MTDVGVLAALAASGRRIVATTAYDFPTATLLNGTPVDFLLVGDSVAMVVYGHPSTRAATLEVMVAHTAAVRRGAPDLLIVADLPYPAMVADEDTAAAAGRALLDAGADAVKVEALEGHGTVVRALTALGIPVMGHVGLLPQTITEAGAFRVRGRGTEAGAVREAARTFQEEGAFAVVLECVPAELGREVTEALQVPTIGIGAGPHTDGQILVIHDLAGLSPEPHPRFVRVFGEAGRTLAEAVERFAAAVRDGDFPMDEESYR
ncbi:MAG TPA: 3-methyl-2-oxobutanoate hydroxymethyltransferase [Longimicrobiales bacterium]|nr:3-methyl-2-oxobutanoate hydroxymethyltransferase [Longimicrobiales bacterium]